MTEVPPLATVDLSGQRRIHVTNIGGAGMSAVATLLSEMGHRVSGHDPAATTPFVAPLRDLGVEVHTGTDRPPLGDDVEAVVTSTATPPDDPDVLAARARDLPVFHRSAALRALCERRRTIAVAGTHGKTTTCALLATILDAAGLDAGWVVGATIPGLGRSATWGGDGPLVVEADESDGTFLALGASTAVVTSVEPDHLEHWGGFDPLIDAFERFLTAASDARIVGADDPTAARLGRAAGAVTVGTSADADVQLRQLEPDGRGVAFRLVAKQRVKRFDVGVRVPLPGIHNARNGAIAVVAAAALGVPIGTAAAAVERFGGVGRRFEARGETAGVTLVDDYAHLPTEVAAALEAAREGPWSRVVCVFQPHRYSRTASLGREFADAFEDADLLAVTDVYGAGEAPREGVSGKLVVDAVLDAHPWRHVAYLPKLDDAVTWLRGVLRAGDLCLTLGAGDVTTLPPRIAAALGDRS